MGPLHPYAFRPAAHGERTESKAVVSLVLGLLSMGCAGPIFGVPAIILGALARRDIDRSSGALSGRATAAGGIVSGLFGTGLGLVVALWVVGAAFAPLAEEPSPNAATDPAPPLAAVADDTAPPATVAAPPPGVRSYGSLDVVDLDDSRPLRAQLIEIVRRSRGRTVVLQTYVKSSSTCDAIAAALPDKRMQLALANVTLVRVDVDEYDRELRRMNIETATAPWFYKLDAKGDPADAISADAWEANAPENMAPVLGRFIHRTPRRGR
jgi:hypothetical protein